mgnify:CR=1 FL=1
MPEPIRDHILEDGVITKFTATIEKGARGLLNNPEKTQPPESPFVNGDLNGIIKKPRGVYCER